MQNLQKKKYDDTQGHALVCDSLKVYMSLKNIQGLPFRRFLYTRASLRLPDLGKPFFFLRKLKLNL